VFIAMDRWLALGNWYEIVTGVSLILTVILNPEGIVGPAHLSADKRAAKRRAKRTVVEEGEVPAEVVTPAGLALAPDTPARPDLLSLRDVSVVYGGVRAVSSVSFDVPAGTIVGLIGPNGAGKTSLIDAITGFATASGEISLAERSLVGLAPHRRVDAGLSRTFQAIELYDDLSVDENIAVGLHNRNGASDTETVDRTLGILGLLPVRDRAAGDLSQGQRQLVSIARALVAQPTVLLLDEPAAGLSSEETRRMVQLVRALKGRYTIVLIEHKIDIIMSVSDRISVMHFGSLIAEGTPTEIQRNPEVRRAYLGGIAA
jgi:ABC-type branched-subunit amino acid transport system ATPase component